MVNRRFGLTALVLTTIGSVLFGGYEFITAKNAREDARFAKAELSRLTEPYNATFKENVYLRSTLEKRTTDYNEAMIIVKRVKRIEQAANAKSSEYEETSANLKKQLAEQRAEIAKAKLKSTLVQETLSKAYSNSPMNQNYPYENFRDLLKEKGVKITDDDKAKNTWERLNPIERESIFLAYLDDYTFEQTMEPKSRERYQRSKNKPITTDKDTLAIDFGWEIDSRSYRDPFSLAMFQIREYQDRIKIFVPGVR